MAQGSIPDAGRLAHAYIITAQDRESCLAAARRLAAAALCSGPEPRPCGTCRDCRKVSALIHPDLQLLRRQEDDKGRRRREITVDQVRAMGADAALLPNEAQRKVYLVEEADAMNLSAQNAALKLLEEPPGGVIFLLCAVNVQALLPTVRSRCALWTLGGESPEDEESLALARDFLRCVEAGDPAELYRWCAANEGLERTAAAAFVDALHELLADRLCGRTESRLRPGALAALLALAERCRDYLRLNVGAKQIFGLLAVDAIAQDGNRG